MSSVWLSAGLLPSKFTPAEDAIQRTFQTSRLHQFANRGGLAGSSQDRASCSAAGFIDGAAQRPTHMRIRAAATMIEAEVSAPDSAKPSSAEVARTIVDLMTHGALATVGEDQIPLGTYASYVLDSQGQPILRLRREAVHTTNLLRNPQCSLFIQPDDMPARILARATLIGKVEKVEGQDTEEAARRHAELHFGGVGVDAPQPTDQYYKLLVDRCFYVGGMGSKCQAEVITSAEYMAASADALRECAAGIVEYQNRERTEDVLRIAAFALGVPLERLEGAQLLWLDRLGIYLFAATVGGPGAQVVRVTFAREVTDERDAQSTLTMLAQVAWEKERNYIPIMTTVPDPVAN